MRLFEKDLKIASFSSPPRPEKLPLGGRLIAVILAVAALQAATTGRCGAQGTIDDYRQWRTYRDRHRDLVIRDAVVPNFFGDNTKFWYRVKTGAKTHQFILVDAVAGTRVEAVNHQKLAHLLAEATGRVTPPSRIDLRGLTFDDDATSCRFRFDGKAWSFQIPDGPLSKDARQFATSGQEGLPPLPRVVRSRHSDEPASIRFENRIDRELTYFWVMPGGGLRRYGSIPAGKSEGLSTYDGHAWVLKDSDGTSIAAFVASAVEDLAVVTADTVRPKPMGGNNRRAGRGRRNQATSPDGKYRVEVDDHNLVLLDTASSDRRAVTGDGSVDDTYGPRVWWAPDSRQFVALKTTPGFNRTIHLIESSPEDSVHARLLEVPYAKPGDRLEHPRPVLFRRADDWKPHLIDDDLFPNPFDLRDFAWHGDSGSFSFLYNQRGHQSLRLITVDSTSARPRVTIDESSETFVCYSSKSYLRRLDATNELIWMSERSGWNHLYLIDAVSGAIKNAITSGSWVVRGVERVDEENRQIFVVVSGIDPDQDPYHQHLIRVNLDGSDLVRLTRGDGNHRWDFSPDHRFLIDTYSRVDMPPIIELRDAQSGDLVVELEQADASPLYQTPWRPPQRFVAKGRDGETDIHGIIIRPTDFDPQQRYPVLEEIYAGPHSAFVPKTFGLHANLYAMAELGFIVVKIDGMGTSHRSKSFHDVCWKNLGDSGFPDRIAWIEAAAKEHPEMDLSRVGVWGGSAGGQSAMRALIAHGDFYHAAVADCGCHDNRVDKIWWNEQWMGWPVGPHYEQQSNAAEAHRLQGDLMLIWGELDRNVDPASTLQVIDALIRADKDFEQLIVPGSGHGAAGHPYARRRQADFFVRKLWKCEPRSK